MTALAQELGPYLDKPEVRQYLSMITQAEGTAKGDDPYRVAFGGKSFDSLDAHPNIRTEFTQTDGKKNVSTAAGAYQFIKPTWDDASSALGLTDFSPRSQDLAAVYLLKKNGTLDSVSKGDYKTAVAKDGKTWASLPSSPYAQNKRSMDFVEKSLGQSGGLISSANAAPTGDSPGDLNAVPASRLLRALEKARSANDEAAVTDITNALTPKLQKGYAQAQEQNDQDAISQFESMLGDVGAPAIRKQGSAPSKAVQNTPAQQPTTQPATAPAKSEFGNPIIDNVAKFSRGVGDAMTMGWWDEISARGNALMGKGNYKDNLKAERELAATDGGVRTAGNVVGTVAMPVGIGGAAARLAPTAGKLGRAAIGAGSGALEGAISGAGNSEKDLKDSGGDALQGAAIGGALGGLGGVLFPASTKQKVNSFVKKAGGEEAARRDAEIIGDLGSLANRESQAGTALGAKNANAVGKRYIQEADDALKLMGKDGEAVGLRKAIQRGGGLNDADLEALSKTPAGAAVVEAIRKEQRAQSMTAAQPAWNNRVARFGRKVADQAMPNTFGMKDFVVNHLLGGRATREQTIQAALKQGDTAQAVLERLGASKASQGTSTLSQLAEDAVAARAARVDAGKATRAAKKVKDEAALIADQQAQDPSFILGLGNPHGVPRNADQMGEFSKVLKAQMESAPETLAARAQQGAAEQAAQLAAQAQAKQSRNELSKATRMPLGGGYQQLLQGGASGLNLTSKEANQGLRALSNHPVLGGAADELRRTGLVQDPQQFYALQNGLRGMKERTAGALSPAPGALSSSIRNPISYAENVRQAGAAFDKAFSKAPTPELAGLVQTIAQTKSTALKKELLTKALANASAEDKAFLNSVVKPLTGYGKK